jgi:hypothetical protein
MAQYIGGVVGRDLLQQVGRFCNIEMLEQDLGQLGAHELNNPGRRLPIERREYSAGIVCAHLLEGGGDVRGVLGLRFLSSLFGHFAFLS